MPIWAWIINPILWVISTCIVGISIRFIFKGVRNLKQAKWSEYADQYEKMLNSSKQQGIDYKKMIDEYNSMISEAKKLLDDKESIPQLSKAVINLEGLQTGLENVTKGNIETLETQIGLLKELTKLAKRGGLPGYSTLSQIEATKNIAIAAVLMVFSSIGFSISSAILSVVK